MAKNKKKIGKTARVVQRRSMESSDRKRKNAKNAAFQKLNRKRVAITVLAAFVLLIAVILCCKWFVSLDGHINMMFGNLRGVGDNWIVTNLSVPGRKYFKLGTFDIPNGYHADPESSLNTDRLARAFYMRSDDDTDKITGVYVTGIANTGAAAMVNRLLGYNMYQENVQAKLVTIDGKEVVYIYAVYDTTQDTEAEEENRRGYSSLVAYVNTSHDSCIMINVSTAETAYAEVATEGEMMPILETVVANLTPDALVPVGNLGASAAKK